MGGAWQSLWAKSDPPHPLWCHLVDVGLVARALWDGVLTESTRARMARGLGMDVTGAANALAWLAAFHDIGKAAPEFQFQWETLAGPVRQAGLPFPAGVRREPHGAISARFLFKRLIQNGWDSSDARRVSAAVGAHHGIVEILPSTWRPEARWNQAQGELIGVVEMSLNLKAPPPPVVPQGVDPVLLLEVAGFVSYADWIGSAPEVFVAREGFSPEQLFSGGVTPDEYAAQSRQRVAEALARFGWRRLPQVAPKGTWSSLFPRMSSPNGLQCAVERILTEQPGTRLLLIEAPMGEGKTEAALFAARHWIREFDQPGAYLALPTQATSNAMHTRVDEWLARVFGGDAIESLLVHGGLLAPAYYEEKKRETFYFSSLGASMQLSEGEGDGEAPPPRMTAHSWFLPTKRALLAPIGTGTIDQALLGGMRAKHHFIRLAGLAGKTVILDEVHAYDAYTSRLLARLIEYLARLDCTVVLLSATLPARRRDELLESFAGCGAGAGDADPLAYPRITHWTPGDRARVEASFGTSERAAKSLRVERLAWDLDEAIRAFVERLGEGGCGAFLVNTVGEAQEAHRRLRELHPAYFERLILFHSRFTAGDRARIEAEVLGLFGRDGDARPRGRAVLVATQVAEQSLDLDFDLMATAIAPIDLLLQRSGRLHRHSRGRPRHLASPTLLVRMPDAVDRAPQFGGTGRVYDPAVLMTTQALLERVIGGSGEIRIPADVAGFIEEVYGDEASVPEAWRDVFAATHAESRQIISSRQWEAEGAGLPPIADAGDLWRAGESGATPSDDESAGYHPDHRALTRLGEESLRVVCLHRVAGIPCLDPDGLDPVPRDSEPTPTTVRRILAQVAGLPRKWFAGSGGPERWTPGTGNHLAGWARHRVLRHLPVLEFEDGRCVNDGVKGVTWSRETGIEKEWE